MKIAALFIDLYLEKGARKHCYVKDLAWAWKLFAEETGVEPPDMWLRVMVIEHDCEIENPKPGKTWRGWEVRGLALNPDTAARYAQFRLERLGVSDKKPGGKC